MRTLISILAFRVIQPTLFTPYSRNYSIVILDFGEESPWSSIGFTIRFYKDLSV